MILNVLTPYGAKFEGLEISAVTLPGEVGEMQILPGHESMMAALKVGIMIVTDTSGNIQVAAVSGGYVEVLEDTINCLIETCELKYEIDVERARQKLQEDNQALEGLDPNTSEYQARLNSRTKAELRIELGTRK